MHDRSARRANQRGIKRAEGKAAESDGANLLMTISSVGYFSTLAIFAEIGNNFRFRGKKKLWLRWTGVFGSSIGRNETIWLIA